MLKESEVTVMKGFKFGTVGVNIRFSFDTTIHSMEVRVKPNRLFLYDYLQAIACQQRVVITKQCCRISYMVEKQRVVISLSLSLLLK